MGEGGGGDDGGVAESEVAFADGEGAGVLVECELAGVEGGGEVVEFAVVEAGVGECGLAEGAGGLVAADVEGELSGAELGDFEFFGFEVVGGFFGEEAGFEAGEDDVAAGGGDLGFGLVEDFVGGEYDVVLFKAGVAGEACAFGGEAGCVCQELWHGCGVCSRGGRGLEGENDEDGVEVAEGHNRASKAEVIAQSSQHVGFQGGGRNFPWDVYVCSKCPKHGIAWGWQSSELP